jgi:hypothetical protein
MTLSDPRPAAALRDVEAATLAKTGLPRCPHHLSNVPCPLPRRNVRVLASIASPSVLPSPYRWRVGFRIFTFETCSGFTLITARWIARPPKATFVTRLQCDQLPSHPARQLPDLSTTIWVDSSSTGDTRPFGAHSDIRGLISDPAYRCAHAGYLLLLPPRPLCDVKFQTRTLLKITENAKEVFWPADYRADRTSG